MQNKRRLELNGGETKFRKEIIGKEQELLIREKAKGKIEPVQMKPKQDKEELEFVYMQFRFFKSRKDHTSKRFCYTLSLTVIY